MSSRAQLIAMLADNFKLLQLKEIAEQLTGFDIKTPLAEHRTRMNPKGDFSMINRDGRKPRQWAEALVAWTEETDDNRREFSVWILNQEIVTLEQYYALGLFDNSINDEFAQLFCKLHETYGNIKNLNEKESGEECLFGKIAETLSALFGLITTESDTTLVVNLCGLKEYKDCTDEVLKFVVEHLETLVKQATVEREEDQVLQKLFDGLHDAKLLTRFKRQMRKQVDKDPSFACINGKFNACATKHCGHDEDWKNASKPFIIQDEYKELLRSLETKLINPDPPTVRFDETAFFRFAKKLEKNFGLETSKYHLCDLHRLKDLHGDKHYKNFITKVLGFLAQHLKILVDKYLGPCDAIKDLYESLTDTGFLMDFKAQLDVLYKKDAENADFVCLCNDFFAYDKK